MKAFRYILFIFLTVMLAGGVVACSGESDDDIITSGSGNNGSTGSTDGTEGTDGTDDSGVTGGTEGEETVVPTFKRNVCVMEFTGQHCSFCPEGYTYMYYYVHRYYEDTAYIIAMHNTGSGSDDFAFEATEAVFADYGIGSNPYSLIDMRETAPLTGDTSGAFRTAIENSINNYPAECGVGVSSTYDSASQTAEVTIKLYSGKTASYYVAAWVVENGIVAYQLNGGTGEDDYTHHYVARALVSSSYKGDSLGSVEVNTETSKTYTLSVDSSWNLEKTEVYALAITADGYVNNVASCAIDGGVTDYEYAEETEE